MITLLSLIIFVVRNLGRIWLSGSGPGFLLELQLGFSQIWKSRKWARILFLNLTSRILYVLSLEELLWASLQHGSLRAVGLLPRQLKDSGMNIPVRRTDAELSFMTQSQKSECYFHHVLFINPSKYFQNIYKLDGRVARFQQSIWDKNIIAIIFGKYNQPRGCGQERQIREEKRDFKECGDGEWLMRSSTRWTHGHIQKVHKEKESIILDMFSHPKKKE